MQRLLPLGVNFLAIAGLSWVVGLVAGLICGGTALLVGRSVSWLFGEAIGVVTTASIFLFMAFLAVAGGFGVVTYFNIELGNKGDVLDSLWLALADGRLGDAYITVAVFCWIISSTLGLFIVPLAMERRGRKL